MDLKKIEDLNLKADEFVKTVVPEDSSDIQKMETKKAFITGMIYGFNIPTLIGLNIENEEEAIGIIFNYNTQLENLQSQLENGTISIPK